MMCVCVCVCVPKCTLIKFNINTQLQALQTKRTPFDSFDETLQLYKLKQPFFPRDFWLHYIGDNLELVKFAVAVLSICPSEASVERTFSAHSRVHRDSRNRLAEYFSPVYRGGYTYQ